MNALGVTVDKRVVRVATAVYAGARDLMTGLLSSAFVRRPGSRRLTRAWGDRGNGRGRDIQGLGAAEVATESNIVTRLSAINICQFRRQSAGHDLI